MQRLNSLQITPLPKVVIQSCFSGRELISVINSTFKMASICIAQCIEKFVYFYPLFISPLVEIQNNLVNIPSQLLFKLKGEEETPNTKNADSGFHVPRNLISGDL